MKKITDERLNAIVDWHKSYSPPWVYEGWRPGEQASVLYELQKRRKADGVVAKSQQPEFS